MTCGNRNLSTNDLLSHLRHLDVKLWIDGDTLRYSAPKGTLTSDLRAELDKRRIELLARLLSDRRNTFHQSIPRFRRTTILPMSIPQEQQLWEEALENDIPPHISIGLSSNPPIERESIEKAFNEILKRHDVLRTKHIVVQGRPRQIVSPAVSISLPEIDLAHLGGGERLAEMRRIVAEHKHKPFELDRVPLCRATLLRPDRRESILLVTFHHIVFDGWSAGVFLTELETLYKQISTGAQSDLPELPIQYADFVLWQRQFRKDKELMSQFGYWRRQLGYGNTLLELPVDHRRPKIQSYRAAQQSKLLVDQECFQALRDLGKQESATVFSVLLAAFKAFLVRYSHHEIITVGTMVANRTRPETWGLIGLFAHEVALRTDLSGDPSFREVLKRVRDVTLEALNNQEIPMALLVKEKDPSYHPITQIGFDSSVYEPRSNWPHKENSPFDFVQLDALVDGENGESSIEDDSPQRRGSLSYDLLLEVSSKKGEGLIGTLSYGTDLFNHSTVTRMIAHLQTALEDIVRNPDERISRLKF